MLETFKVYLDKSNFSKNTIIVSPGIDSLNATSKAFTSSSIIRALILFLLSKTP